MPLLWKKMKGVLMTERWNMCDRDTIQSLVKVNACADFALREACSADQTEKEKKKKEEAKGTSLKLGAGPKATKVALDPESLSPAEDTRTVVLFNRNHFSPGTKSALV